MSTRKIASRTAYARGRLIVHPVADTGWYAGDCPCGWYYTGTYGLFERHADVCHRLRPVPEEERIHIAEPIRVLVCSVDESGGVA